MGGVGSFMRQNRTLYGKPLLLPPFPTKPKLTSSFLAVGRIHVTDDIEEVVARHFSEWGPVERIRVLTSRGVGFVTYAHEANAQFAKEAMAHQALDHNEVLNVRWATVDPNPVAQKREVHRIEEQAAEAIRRALPAEYVAEIEGRDPEAKKRRRVEGGFGLQGYEAPDDVWYAAEKARLEAPEERLLIEDAGMQGGEGKQQKEEETGGGILSGSTLAALQSYSGGSGIRLTTSNTAATAAPAGPLVGYGSDDDSD